MLALLRTVGLWGASVAAVTAAVQDPSLFRSGVDLVDVTVTVTDRSGRFVTGLQQADFEIFEDGRPQEIAYFSADRAPVSLGIALDTSGSMTADKMSSSRSAIERLANELLGVDDEVFYMQFANRPDLIQPWTKDVRAIGRAVGHAFPAGGTALYDAMAEAVTLTQTGHNRKKALLVVSDGNDTQSDTSPRELERLIRDSDVLVYAIGVDGRSRQVRRPPEIRVPPILPFPAPGRRPPLIPGLPQGGRWGSSNDDRVDADALRQLTDPSGGRTEIVRDFGDLAGATSRIADELGRQYQIAYPTASAGDGRWHGITVRVRDRSFVVRARNGFVGRPAS